MGHFTSLAWIIWNPDRVVFTFPFINRPVTYYGLWFVLGFIIGYRMLLPVLQEKLNRYGHNPTEAHALLDRLTWFIIGGTIIGARLGHVFFYEWGRYAANPWEIPAVWNGGLASHGGTLGILLALYLYCLSIRKRYPEITFMYILDTIVIPVALTGCFIRIGNFWNQEVLGIPTLLPWGIIFADPADGGAIVPRHPVQLYEAFAYLLSFFLLYALWKKASAFPGRLSGIFFICVFGSRMILEIFKTSQGSIVDETFLQMGQYLSIPVIALGIWLLVQSFKKQPLYSSSVG